MTTIALFYIKANISLGIFYLLYQLLFAKDTFWTIKRYYWWVVAFFSIYLPMINVNVPFLKPREASVDIDLTGIQVGTLSMEALPTENNSVVRFFVSVDFQQWILAIYLLIVSVLLIRMLLQYFSVFKIRKESTKKEKSGRQTIFYTDKNISPFSFFQSIFINSAHFKNKREINQVLMHEKYHCRKWHSLDMLLGHLLTVAFWFNPLVWLIKREIIMNNEFLADQEVVSQGADNKAYQHLLVRESCADMKLQITNNFYVSPLKKRIIMLNKIRTKSISLLKYFAILPLAIAIILVANTGELKAQTSEQNQIEKEKTITKKTNDDKIEIDRDYKDALVLVDGKPYDKPINSIDVKTIESINVLKDKSATDVYSKKGVVLITTKKVYNTVDTPPQFVGGNKALYSFIAKNIVYPLKAAENGISGKVITQFVVEEDGEMSDVQVVRGVHPDLDKEAIRVVKIMPKWVPGKQKEKNVRVKYTLPIVFALNTTQKVYDKVDTPPQFVGGNKAMYDFIAKNIVYLPKAAENGISGKVITQFVVEEDGAISDVQVVRGVHPDLDKEAIRVVKIMPKWVPGKQKEKNVRVKYTLPIIFSLH